MSERRILQRISELGSEERKLFNFMHFAFQTETHLFLALEYCPGGDFYSLCNNLESGMNEDDAKFYAANIVLALESLHEKGIVHRDIKAENILIGQDGYLKLADFGHAKDGMLNGRRTFSKCGTRNFMAPEMLRAG